MSWRTRLKMQTAHETNAARRKEAGHPWPIPLTTKSKAERREMLRLIDMDIDYAERTIGTAAVNAAFREALAAGVMPVRRSLRQQYRKSGLPEKGLGAYLKTQCVEGEHADALLSEMRAVADYVIHCARAHWKASAPQT